MHIHNMNIAELKAAFDFVQYKKTEIRLEAEKTKEDFQKNQEWIDLDGLERDLYLKMNEMVSRLISNKKYVRLPGIGF